MLFDIGANVGMWSLAHVASGHRIVSIEPSPTTFQALLENCRGNDQITCLNYAVCANGGRDITFYDCHASTLSTLNKEWLTSPESRFYNYPYVERVCKTITIDSLISLYGVPDLIKIDVEGGEFQCIRSLSQLVPLLCFEWASETEDVTHRCIEHLCNLGFKEYCLQHGDEYRFRPEVFSSVAPVQDALAGTTPRCDWGMIWCR